MKRKVEDQLVRLAFGDITPEEAKRLESQAIDDPEAAKALAEYRRMKEDLRSLAEVPSDQLSKERLREAILKRGLKQEPEAASSNRGWLWLPVAACALAFTFTIWRNTNSGIGAGPVAMVTPEDLSLGQDAELNNRFNIQMPPLDKGSDLVATNDAVKASTMSVEQESTVREPRQAVARKTPRRGTTRTEPELSAEERALLTDIVKNGVMPHGSGSATSEVPEMTNSEQREALQAPPKEPIILIVSEKDQGTGANRAVEVSSSNVLVGG